MARYYIFSFIPVCKPTDLLMGIVSYFLYQTFDISIRNVFHFTFIKNRKKSNLN